MGVGAKIFEAKMTAPKTAAKEYLREGGIRTGGLVVVTSAVWILEAAVNRKLMRNPANNAVAPRSSNSRVVE